MVSNLAAQLLLGFSLSMVQCLLALPWAWLLLKRGLDIRKTRGQLILWMVGVVLGLGLIFSLALTLVKDTGYLQLLGKVYGSVLQAQLTADLFVALFGALLFLWPKGGAVALAAFREAIRQPVFLLILIAGLVLMILIPFIPYFTFGEDHFMAKGLGLEVIMLGCVVFGVLLASTSISEEIEGRTAITLMSKPVSRQQFLLGKFFGLLLACLLLTGILAWFYNYMMDFKYYYEQALWYDSEPSKRPQFPSWVNQWLLTWVGGEDEQSFLRGTVLWALNGSETLPELILGFCQVMVLLAVAVCLATRLPVVANVISCVVLFVLGHLSPILVQSAQSRAPDPSGESTVATLLLFMAQLFHWVLPNLQLFSPTQITDVQTNLLQLTHYSGEVACYSLMFTAIFLLLGLILFEDRDLA